MARYFFDLTTANFIVLDRTNGRELGDNAAARDCAVESIKAIMDAKPWRGLDPTTSAVDVTDERGKLFFSVPFADALRSAPNK